MVQEPLHYSLSADLLEPRFGRHETFHLRYGWLKKAYDASLSDPDIFLDVDATTRLGVGKNMVRAIRYWAVAFGVLAEEPDPANTRQSQTFPTEFGVFLLDDDGRDPFLEDPSSLWLLHWNLLRPPCSAPSWWLTFGEMGAAEFSSADLLSAIRQSADRHPEWGSVADGSVVKDVRCLLRMYAATNVGRDLIEDSLDSPFVELNLLRRVPGSGDLYVFETGPKPSLRPEVVVYSVLDYIDWTKPSTKVMSLAQLTFGVGSPGQIFRLTEDEMFDLLLRAEHDAPGLRVTQSAGLRQVTWSDLYSSTDALAACFGSSLRLAA